METMTAADRATLAFERADRAATLKHLEWCCQHWPDVESHRAMRDEFAARIAELDTLLEPTPTPGAPLAAPTVYPCDNCGHDVADQPWYCVLCSVVVCSECFVCHEGHLRPDPQTHQEREAAQRADEAAWLPMAGGSGELPVCPRCRLPFCCCPPTSMACVDGDCGICTMPGCVCGCHAEGTPAGDAARWLANRGLPPMAGGAPSHYTDPAWLADEAWAWQEERNAESAREEADIPPECRVRQGFSSVTCECVACKALHAANAAKVAAKVAAKFPPPIARAAEW